MAGTFSTAGVSDSEVLDNLLTRVDHLTSSVIMTSLGVDLGFRIERSLG